MILINSRILCKVPPKIALKSEEKMDLDDSDQFQNSQKSGPKMCPKVTQKTDEKSV